MIKYLRIIINRLNSFISGMENNSTLWQGQIETEASVKSKLQLLEDKEAEIIKTKGLLSRLSAEARELQSEIANFADGMEKLARGLHKDTPEKLAAYGIAFETTRKHSHPPEKILALVIKDDTDGEGFIVSVKSADTAAKNYEFGRGESTDAADVNHIPPMSHYKITSKMSFVDNDVLKGHRYWYRVRALNRKGAGPWSESSSRVQ